MTADDLTLSAVAGVAALDGATWNRCADSVLPRQLDSFSEAPRRCGERADSFSQQTAARALTQFVNHSTAPSESYSQLVPHNPFISHDFLTILERSGCVGGRTGWRPLPLVAQRGKEIIGVAPAYLKAHSHGEYVFDHGWADAYERAGRRYYPKLQIAVPFTPVTGPRLLAADEGTRAALADGLIALAAQTGASSVHVTFPTRAEAEALEARGWLLRLGEQYHFRNDGYRDYEDFLSTLASRKRKALKRERREALASGVEIEWLTGAAIAEAHWDAFFAFYMDTGSRKWGRPYLNRAFFSLLGEAMADRVLLVMARRGARYVAGALNLIGADALYGRYWGAVEETPFLHFELCYHQAIDYALAHGLSRVEAGAQGEHKLARGYRPTPTWSAHHIADPALRRAVADYLKRERAMMREAIAQDDAASPFRKSPQSSQDVTTIREDEGE